MQFHDKNLLNFHEKYLELFFRGFDLFDFTIFLPEFFFNFLAVCQRDFQDPHDVELDLQTVTIEVLIE